MEEASSSPNALDTIIRGEAADGDASERHRPSLVDTSSSRQQPRRVGRTVAEGAADASVGGEVVAAVVGGGGEANSASRLGQKRARDEEEGAELDADGEGPQKKPRYYYQGKCDVCKEQAFDTREQAVEHEEQCDGGAAEPEGGPGVGGEVTVGEGQGEGEGAGEDAGRESEGPDAPPARLVSGDAANAAGGVSSAGAGDPQPKAAAVRDDGEAAEDVASKSIQESSAKGGDATTSVSGDVASAAQGMPGEGYATAAVSFMERLSASAIRSSRENIEKNVAPAVEEAEEAKKRAEEAMQGMKQAIGRMNSMLFRAMDINLAVRSGRKLIAPLKAKIEALEAERKDIEARAAEFEDHCHRGTAEYGAGVVAADHAAKLRETWAAEMKAVDDKLAGKRAFLARVEGLLAEGVKRLVREVPRHVREQSARIVSLQRANDEATQQVAKTGVALEEALTELREEKAQRADEREELEAAKASAEGRVAVLERELGEERGATGRASNLAARLEEAAGTNAKLVEEVASLTTAREEATALLEAANARFASLGEEAATTQRRLSVEAKELREAKAEAEKRAATTESGRELEQRQVAAVKRQCEEAEANVRRLAHENNVLRLERDNREAQAAAEKADLERQLAELQAKLDAEQTNSAHDAMSVGAASENNESMEIENSSHEEEEEQREKAIEECTSDGEREQRMDRALRPGNDDSVKQSVGADIAEQPVGVNVADQDAEREDGGDAEESIPNNGVDSVANLALFTQGAFLSLCGTGMLVEHLPAMQGRDNDSNNGCAAIAALVASQSLASGALPDADIVHIINRSAGPVLDAVRKKRNEGPGTFIHLVDVLDYLYDNGHLQRSQFLDTVGGSALDDACLAMLKASLSRDDVGRVAAVFFFRSHLVALRVVRDEESNVVWVELIDSLARGAWVGPGDHKTEDAVRVRCKIEHLTTLLKHYCLSRYTDDDKRWIDRAGPWDEREPGTDRRSFEAYIFCDRNGEQEDIQEFVVENDDAMDVESEDAVGSGTADVASREETSNEEQDENEMAIDEEVSEETSNEMAVDEPSPARKEKELSWTIWQLLQPSTILGPNPAVCDTEICDLAACSIWSLGGNRGVRTSLCLDCQEKDRGGWPQNPSDLPFPAISKMQIEAMTKWCSIHANPDMPYVHQEGDFICSDPKCQNLLICDAPGDYCSECGCPYCQDHLDEDGVCPACIEAFEAIDDESMDDGDASGVTITQLRQLATRYCGVILFESRKGTIGPSAFRADLQLSKFSAFGTTYGTAVEAFFVAAAARYCVDRHPGCAASDDLRTLLNDREGQVDIVNAYLRQRRKRCLLADRDNNIRVALQRVSNMVSEADFESKLRSLGNLDEERLKEVREYFGMLARLTLRRINAIRQGTLSAEEMRPYELPWATLDRQQLADVANESTAVSHSRTIYSNDVDMLQLHSFFKEFFIGTSAKGGPGWHATLSTEASKIGYRSDQDDEVKRIKEMRLKFLIFLLFRAFSSKLAPDDISALFAAYVPEEWRGLPGMHPEITAGNVYEVVTQARNSVVSFLENATIGGESLVANPELLSALSVLHGSLDGDASAIELANVMLQEKIGANLPRLEREYAARLEHEENIDAKRDAFFNRLEALREVFDWVDTYRTGSKGQGGDALTKFLAKLRGRLAKLDISPDDIERIMAYAPNSKQWANAVDKARNNALGRLGCLIVKALGEFCFGGCGRRLLDMLSNASHIDHEDRPAKTAHPSTIANNDGLVALLDEIFKTFSTPKCLDCHDMGEHRSFLLRLYKKLLLVEPDSPRTHDNRLTPTEALLTNAISYVRFTLFVAESYAGDWRNHGSDFAHVRGTTLCVFGIAVDGLVNFEARRWNGENTGIHHNTETDQILERLIGQACGFCFNPECLATSGDLTRKSPFSLYGDVWDHNRKKSEGISDMISSARGPVCICSEICSWTDKLCGPCNAKRDATQRNGCKERCFEDVGACDCGKVRGKERYPKKV